MIVSEKLLSKSKDWLLETTKAWQTGVCKGKCVELDEALFDEPLYPPHTACHSWVTYSFKKAMGKAQLYGGWNDKFDKNSRNFLTLSCYGRSRHANISQEASDALVLWMARESPFSQYVLNRDDEKSLTEGGVVLLCGPDGLTLTEAMWVCKVLRFPTEGGKAAETFLALLQGGVDGMLAVYIASHIRSVKGATFGYTGLEGHSTVFSTNIYNGLERIDLVALYKRKTNRFAENTAVLFHSPATYKLSGKLKNPAAVVKGFCKPFKKPDGWGGFITGEGADAEALVKHALEWQGQIEKLITPEPVGLPDASTVYLELDL